MEKTNHFKALCWKWIISTISSPFRSQVFVIVHDCFDFKGSNADQTTFPTGYMYVHCCLGSCARSHFFNRFTRHTQLRSNEYPNSESLMHLHQRYLVVNSCNVFRKMSLNSIHGYYIHSSLYDRSCLFVRFSYYTVLGRNYIN